MHSPDHPEREEISGTGKENYGKCIERKKKRAKAYLSSPE